MPMASEPASPHLPRPPPGSGPEAWPDDLRAEIARLRTIFDHAPCLVAAHYGPEHVLAYINPMVERLVGGRPIVGLPFREAMPDFKGQGQFRRYDQAFRSGQPVLVPELRLSFDATGTGRLEDFWFNHSLQPWREAKGRLLGLIAISFEVTELVRTRQALEESERRFRTLADSAPVMIWMAGPDGRATYFNQRWIEFTGRGLEEELGEGWVEVVHPRHRERCCRIWAEALRTRRSYRIEYRLRRADGAWRWVLSTSVPRFTPEGTFVGFVGSVLDIHERREVEQALRESEQRYRTLLERASDAIFVFPVEADGRPGRYLEVNEVACRRLGYSREELLALTPEAVVDTGELPYGDALDTAMRDLRIGGSIVVERVHLTKDGRRIPVEVSATLLELGDRPTVVTIARDITERKRAEAAIRESEERLRFTLEAAGVGTWDWDTATGQVQWSDNLEPIHGLPRGSFGGDFESVLQDVDPKDREVLMTAIAAAVERGGDYHVEYRLPSKGAAVERWVEGKGRAIHDEHGRPVRMAGICMDITERKSAERTRQLLLWELQHRVRNTLTVVQSLAAQTLRNSPSLEAFGEAFQGRLSGLAQAHNLLLESNWQGADLRQLILAELAPWRDQQEGFVLTGPSVTVSSRAALSLGMALHELATNAAKYGALSRRGGRVEIAWEIEGEGEARHLVLRWSERGGPRVTAPERQGFGTRLIELSVGYELDGTVRQEFRPNGLACEMRVPLAEAGSR
jgi:PAS domain S-box-containing protein